MPNATLVNFAAGETSPRSRGRFDLTWFTSACQKMLNYVAEVPGPARYRSGFRMTRQTRGGALARLITFQLNDTQAYMLEFTAGKMRAYKDEELITAIRATVTGVTKALTAVLSVSTASGLANGDEIIISGMEGMFELNGRQVQLANGSGTTFQLVDPVTGAGIDSRNFGAWTSGGSVYEVVEIDSPYSEADLDNIHEAQTNTEMYFTCPGRAPYKLTVDSADVFTLATYTRTQDPFEAGSAINLTGAGLAGTAVIVTFALGTLIDGTIPYDFAAVGGMTQLNGNSYLLRVGHSLGIPENPPTNVRATLLDPDTGVQIDGTGYGTYTSGGTATPQTETPLSVAFYESRLFFFGTNRRPNTVFGSRAPDDDGNPRYDDFTGGTSDDHAVFFALAPASGQVDFLSWGRGTSKYLFAGTFGGPFRISGSGLDEPITPGSITVRQIDLTGCEAVMPAGGSRLFFIQRGGTTLRTVRYNADIDDFETYDMCLNAEHIAASRLRRVAIQSGRPDVLWVVREDGILAGMTVAATENIAGWHRHKIGGQAAKVLDVQALPRSDKDDQLWIVTERSVNGVTRRFVERQADDVVFPDIEDFYGGNSIIFADDEEDEPGHQSAGQADDLTAWLNAVYRRQEEYIHLDAAGTYNGSDRGAAAEATLTPGALTGEGVAFTASAAVFKSTDVGSELWKKPDRETGFGSGRAVITAYVSSTQVTCDVEVDFDTLEAIEAGGWHIAVDTIYAPYLDGEVVAVVTDGAVYSDGRGDVGDFPTVRVVDGKITLDRVSAVVHVGKFYDGFIKTHNLEMGGRSGPAQDKPRNISELYLRLLYSLGTSYGTDLYRLERISHRSGADVMDRPSPVFSGIKKCPHTDNWGAEEEKHVIIAQQLPLPSIVQFIDIHYESSDEG